MFTSGRVPDGRAGSPLPADGAHGVTRPTQNRLNVADIILAAVGQSSGKLRFEDFTPLPCGDPNCATIGYLLKVGSSGFSRSGPPDGGAPNVRSISDFIDFPGHEGPLQTGRPDEVRLRIRTARRFAQTI
jgi:hypothetical protein